MPFFHHTQTTVVGETWILGGNLETLKRSLPLDKTSLRNFVKAKNKCLTFEEGNLHIGLAR